MQTTTENSLVIIDLVFGTGAWRFLNLQTGVWRLVIRIFVILAHSVLQCARIMKKALRFVSARRKKTTSRECQISIVFCFFFRISETKK